MRAALLPDSHGPGCTMRATRDGGVRGSGYQPMPDSLARHFASLWQIVTLTLLGLRSARVAPDSYDMVRHRIG